MIFVRFVLAVVFIVAAVACGRSSPNVACTAREGLGCDELAKISADQEKQFTAAVQAGDGNAAGDTGTCNATAVNLELQRSCIADRCAEICSLAPCAIQANGDCEATCTRLKLSDDVLGVGAVRAARTPGLCSCNVCVNDDGSKAKDDTAKLCTELFVCP